ncbi:MAG: porin family protein [Cognatishimia sp.]|uniref:outer membrane protein n=1 Tax=Cognatishimia sp. TaxID=2211648 RepID=UPI003B8DC5C5
MKHFLKMASAAICVLGSTASGQDWNGFYAGALGSSGSTTFDWVEGGAPSLGAFSGDFSNTGIGAFAGYNIQRNDLIYGVEIDTLTLNGTEAFTGVPGPGDVNAQLNRISSVRGRIGYSSGSVLPYFFLGAATGKAEVEAVGFSTQAQTHTGITYGAGVDVKIWRNAFMRAEIGQTKLRSERSVFCGLGCPADIEFSRTEARIGFGMKF